MLITNSTFWKSCSFRLFGSLSLILLYTNCSLTESDCQAQPTCIQKGLCSLLNGRCVAGSDADCKASRNCRLVGACTEKSGACIATTSEDCLNSEVCKRENRCAVGYNGECTKLTQAHCRISVECFDEGRCVFDASYDRCIVTNDYDCQQSQACLKEQRCAADRGRCLDCRLTARCILEGLCGLSKGKCVASSDLDCERSEVCKSDKRCKMVEGSCVVPPSSMESTLATEGSREFHSDLESLRRETNNESFSLDDVDGGAGE